MGHTKQFGFISSCILTMKKMKITQLEKVCFIKVNKLKLSQVELFSFFHCKYAAAYKSELLCMAHLTNNESFLYHSNLTL